MKAAGSFFRTSITWTEIVTICILVLLLGMLLLAAMPMCGCGGGQITKSIANCRQIILSIRLYAEDHDGAYPDSKVPLAADSNTVFRQLIKEGALEDEKIFGCGASRFNPDGNIGTAPDYIDAVAPGENHWAMTKGLSDLSPPGIPLVYENPVEASWPPHWNSAMAGRSVKGRSWKGGKVIIGTNDTSVELLKLSSSKGTRVSLKPDQDGLNLFERHAATRGSVTPQVLDVAEFRERAQCGFASGFATHSHSTNCRWGAAAPAPKLLRVEAARSMLVQQNSAPSLKRRPPFTASYTPRSRKAGPRASSAPRPAS